MQITVMVLRAGFLMAWSRNVLSLNVIPLISPKKIETNQTLMVDLHIGNSLDTEPHNHAFKIFLNIKPNTIVEEHKESNKYPLKDDLSTPGDYKQSPNATQRRKKKKKKISNTLSSDEDGTRYIYFPTDGDYSIFKVALDIPKAKKLDIVDTDVSYWLYTRKNPTSGHKIRKNDIKSVKDSKFNAKKISIFLSHGYLGNRDTPANIALTEAFLHNSDVNVIRQDWGSYASSMWHPTAAGYAPEIGKMFGKFIMWLHRAFELSLDKVHLVGFSLGAHVVGNAGRELFGKAKRLTALDPAGPGWQGAPECLNKSDARYVEVIHTNGGYLSIGHRLGHSDHYPNGGFTQPNCSSWRMSKHICSHNRAYELMAATVKLDHLQANKCASVKHANEDKCTGILRSMGNADINKIQAGVFRVNTRGRYPF